MRNKNWYVLRMWVNKNRFSVYNIECKERVVSVIYYRCYFFKIL